MNVTMKTLVMNFVQSRGNARRKDIVKFIHECKGMRYIAFINRGYWSTAFVTSSCRIGYKDRNPDDYQGNYTRCGYFMKPSKVEKRYLVQDRPYGPYRVETAN